MTIFKRLVKVVFVVLLLVITAGAVVVYRSRQVPEWYAHRTILDASQRELGAIQSQNKMSAALDWAANRTAAETRARLGLTDEQAPPADTISPASTQPVLAFSFSENELNASFQKWSISPQVRWKETFGKFLDDPVIAIRDGRIILGGRVIALDQVVSLHFKPVMLKNGKVELTLDQVMAGRQAMPQVLFEKYRKQLLDGLEKQLPAQQRAARISESGVVNDAAMNTAMGKLLMNVMARRETEPVVFLPVKLPSRDFVPVKLTGLNVEGTSINVTLEMMNAAERSAFLAWLRQAP